MRAVAAIGRFLHTQRAKIDAIIDGRADPGDAMLRPHVRFDGERLAELPERWAHAQNEASSIGAATAGLAAARDCLAALAAQADALAARKRAALPSARAAPD